MVSTLCYKVLDLSPLDDASPAQMEDILNHQAEEGWELVTSFQRTPKALQGGSTLAPVPGLLSTVLVFKRADDSGVRTGGPSRLSAAAHAPEACSAADIRDARPGDIGDQRVRITSASTRSADVDSHLSSTCC